jgi:hypothetical protein
MLYIIPAQGVEHRGLLSEEGQSSDVWLPKVDEVKSRRSGTWSDERRSLDQNPVCIYVFTVKTIPLTCAAWDAFARDRKIKCHCRPLSSVLCMSEKKLVYHLLCLL